MRIIDTVVGAIVSLMVTGVMISPLAANERPGFIVVAADRGFMGNEEIRDAFEALTAKHPAALVFVTDERGKPYFAAATRRLKRQGATRVIVLPLYLSGAHPDFARLQDYYDASVLPVEVARIFGHSAMAPVALADRVRETQGDLLVVGDSAESESDVPGMRRDFERLLDAVRAEFPHRTLDVAVWQDDKLREALKALPADTQVLPFHLGQELDSMMSYSAYLDYLAPKGVSVVQTDAMPHRAVAAWMLREAARAAHIPPERTGVVIHAHGSDFHWNETMREAAAPLAEDYLVEYAFSMGDAPTLERAVRNLEERGADAVVIVRVFGLADSFRDGIERFIGMDYEQCRATSAHAGHGHGGHHAAPARLLTNLPVATAGGLEDHDLFAAALLDRAREISEDAGNETVILVAHGVGDDEGNNRWLALLASLREKMLARGGDDFRGIEVATWREDWPDKRDAAVARVRELVASAHRDGGRALVIPARTTAQGPARELIPDMDYSLGNGFAPHPLFVEWLREQVDTGLRELGASGDCAM